MAEESSEDKPATSVPDNSGSSTTPAVTVRPVEQSESVPLNKNSSGSRRWSLCGCGSSDDAESLHITVYFFAFFTIAVTIALIVQIHYGAFEVAPHGSVSSDSETCSLIGTNLLKRGGNAVDAAVASTLCMGVVFPHVTGLGGGGFLLIYDHKRRRGLDSIDFREAAPSSLSPTPASAATDNSPLVGIPGTLKGLYAAHSTYGVLPWKDVVEPSIQLAREGLTIPQNLLDSKDRLAVDASGGNEAFHQFLEQIQPGGTILQPRLADALEVIADHGPDALYNGSLSVPLLSTVAAHSPMTLNDLADYRAESRRPLLAQIGDYSVMVPGAPSGGPLLLSVLSILGTPFEHPEWWPAYATEAQHIQRLAETLRLAALYHGQLGDPDQSPEVVQNGTLQMISVHVLDTLRREVEQGGGSTWSNWQLPEPAGTFVGVIDNNELYVAVVSGLNSRFGSRLMSPLGFLLNDALINFTPRPAASGVGESSAANWAAPGRRPLSLATPVVVFRSGAPCGKRLVLGSPDAAIAAQALANIIAAREDVTSAIELPRVALRIRNLTIEPEHMPLLNEQTLMQLEGAGYRIVNVRPPYAPVNVVQKLSDDLSAHSDSRGGGTAISY